LREAVAKAEEEDGGDEEVREVEDIWQSQRRMTI
jgi:hypothetical protein